MTEQPARYGADGTITRDMINHPPHYTFGAIEVIDAIEAFGLSYAMGNVLKYIARAKHKGSELDDLRKAAWYLAREITRLEAAK